MDRDLALHFLARSSLLDFCRGPLRSRSYITESIIMYTIALTRVNHEVDNLYGARRYKSEETERLAKNTGRSRSFLAAEAINEYLEVNEWQVAGIKRAIASLDRGEGISHDQVKDWVASWGSANEKPAPKSS
jgi:RHH-type transcriptional regulator, rel operon repressor / antitoxin RelB